MSTDDDRTEYLEQGGSGAVPDAAERAELDAVRDLLATPELWDDPPADLEDRVVAAIDAAIDAEAPAPVSDLGSARAHRRGSWLALVAAAAVVAVVGIGVFLAGRSDPVDTFAFTLEPTALAPDAAGSIEAVKTASGWRIDFDVDGLERLDAGNFYEAWLVNDDGILVPVGTFNEGTDVVLWAGVPLIEYSTLSVTIESADGDQASSGERVLVAELSTENG